MRIDVKDLIEFLECPLRHKFRKEGAEPNRTLKGMGFHSGTPVYEEFDAAIHKIAHYVFQIYSNGRWPSTKTLAQKWGSIWVKERSIDENTSWRNERLANERRGFRWILKMAEKFRDRPGTPLLIGKDYIVKIGNHELCGTIDLVRELDGEIEIVIFSTDDRARVLHSAVDLRATAASYAFRKLTGVPESRIIFYGFQTAKMIETKRDERDFKALETTLDNVEKALASGIVYPVLNYKCYECPFEKHCMKKEWL
jgi:CRISPR/Cas system-associated exonuclease Cas4 (RecB family)